jgi:NAD(P)-dependent dehydrogenase (short-subunit alcohol dehydrogenase family)
MGDWRNDMESKQEAIESGFSAASTTAHVIRGVDLVGKVAVVTGGYSGLGREAVRTFVSAGARVIVPSRDVPRARAALDGVGGVEIWPMDLLDPPSVDMFASRFLDSGLPLDILMNNAAIMATPKRTLDARGHETQFATNHLGHFHLTARLWPALARTRGARVVIVSSLGHRFSPVIFDDIHFERRSYDPWSAYGQSKTANILFARELDRRAAPLGVRAFSLHPGGIPGTTLSKHIPNATLVEAGLTDDSGRTIVRPERDVKSIAQGAATQVWCATSPMLEGKGGVFCLDCDIANLLPAGTPFSIGDNHSDARVAGVEAFAIDDAAARELWTVSERLCGVRFTVEPA